MTRRRRVRRARSCGGEGLYSSHIIDWRRARDAGCAGRRLPISQATTTVITGQQDRVRARFPGTPPAGLRLLPAARCNPDGRKPMTIDMFEGRHRESVDALGPLHTRDGAAVDPVKVTPYAYRHTCVICSASDPVRDVGSAA